MQEAALLPSHLLEGEIGRWAGTRGLEPAGGGGPGPRGRRLSPPGGVRARRRGSASVCVRFCSGCTEAVVRPDPKGEEGFAVGALSGEKPSDVLSWGRCGNWELWALAKPGTPGWGELGKSGVGLSPGAALEPSLQLSRRLTFGWEQGADAGGHSPEASMAGLDVGGAAQTTHAVDETLRAWA